MYKITIQKVTEVTERIKGGSYTQLKSEYINAQQYDLMSFDERKDYKPVSYPTDTKRAHGAEYAKSIYGYLPEIDSTKEVSVEILSQTVEDMDVSAVIKAINKL